MYAYITMLGDAIVETKGSNGPQVDPDTVPPTGALTYRTMGVI